MNAESGDSLRQGFARLAETEFGASKDGAVEDKVASALRGLDRAVQDRGRLLVVLDNLDNEVFVPEALSHFVPAAAQRVHVLVTTRYVRGEAQHGVKRNPFSGMRARVIWVVTDVHVAVGRVSGRLLSDVFYDVAYMHIAAFSQAQCVQILGGFEPETEMETQFLQELVTRLDCNTYAIGLVRITHKPCRLVGVLAALVVSSRFVHVCAADCEM